LTRVDAAPKIDQNNPHLWDPAFKLDEKTFFNGGPFFVSCDHGCGTPLTVNKRGSGPFVPIMSQKPTMPISISVPWQFVSLMYAKIKSAG
jgi:hypothetical protein